MSAESLVTRLITRRQEAAPPIQEDILGRPLVGPCWLAWSMYRNGYGRIKIAATRSYALIHRISYETFVGPISGELDHLCRTPRCYNPSHLEDVTRSENIQRSRAKRVKARCPRGHSYKDPENVYVAPNGERFCRACGRIATAAYRLRQRAAA